MTPHEILARVAIEAYSEWNTQVGLFRGYLGRSPFKKYEDPGSCVDFVAAALSKHMVHENRFVQLTPTGPAVPLFRITDKPQEASDATGD